MFALRSDKKELLDKEDIPVVHLHRNLYELDVINRRLGGHSVTLNAINELRISKDKTYTILDIGSGGGDTLKAVALWAENNGYRFVLTGVDLKQDCIGYAKSFCKDYPNISFIQSDYKDLLDKNIEFDIIITSLFCHHLKNNEMVELFSKCASKSRVAFIVNDLHRNAFAYYSISLLTSLFSKSHLVKNDAKLSVLRGFKKEDLKSIINQARLKGKTVAIKWCWAFRWLVVVKSNIAK